MRSLIPLALLMPLAMGISGAANATATQTGGTLDIFMDAAGGDPSNRFDHAANIDVLDGAVTLSGVPDVTDFTTFTGVNAIVVRTGGGGDTVNILVDTDRDIDIAVQSGGQAEVKIGMVARAAAGAFTSNIDMDFGFNEDKLELDLESRRDTMLNVRVDSTGGEKLVGIKAMYAPGTNASNLFDFSFGGREDQAKIEIKSEANQLNSVFVVNSGDGEDLIGISVDHQGNGPANNDVALFAGGAEDSVEMSINAPFATVGLSGMIDVGDSQNKVGLEVNSRDVDMASLGISAGSVQDSLSAGFKGPLNLSGAFTLSGGGGDDTLSLKAEGGVTGAGTVTLDGGGGFLDKCEAFPGVVFVNCEDVSL